MTADHKPTRVGGARFVVPFNEAELLIQFFKDKTLNHGLTELIKNFRVVPLLAESVGVFPALLVWEGQLSNVMLSEVDYDYDADPSLIGGEYPVAHEMDVQMELTIIMLESQAFKYNGVKYNGAAEGIYVLREIIMTMLSEHDVIESEDGTTALSSPNILGVSPSFNWEGIPDAWAVEMSVTFHLQHRILYEA